jgi:hypothetical protein
MLLNSSGRFEGASGWAANADNYETPDGENRKLVISAICRH